MARIRTSSRLLAAGLALLAPAGASAAIPVPDASGPSAAPDRRAFGAAVTIWPARNDADYRRLFLDTFNSLTPENEMKWSLIHPAPNRWAFANADALVDWGREAGKRVRGHTLVWDEQLPLWMRLRFWNARDMERVLRDHVFRIVDRYKGRVESWDVVNEPLAADGTLERNLFYRVLGPRYIEIAFQAARDADPDARLFLNEIGAERSGVKRDGLFGLARYLQRRGVPLDGIGFQNHATAGQAPTRLELIDLMRRAEKIGLDSEITELDLAHDRANQADENGYVAAASACSRVKRCTGVTVWGVTDSRSWLGADRRGLLFDVKGRAKPVLTDFLRVWQPILR